MKQVIKTIARNCLYKLHHYKFERFYRKIMSMNNIPNNPTPGEDAWVEKWSQLGLKASPTQYRVFHRYIGTDINIVPEDICHDIIEPLLNPFRFAGYYADKNVFDRLFPKGYFPKTFLRKMNGIWYDADYVKKDINEEELQKALSCEKKVIIKPSVDGMSGQGVQLFTSSPDEQLTNVHGERLTLEYINNHFGSNIIIQEAVQQNEYISQFNPTSVNTLRVSLYRSVKDDQYHITGAIMRIGGKGSVVDNSHAGGCFVGIHQDGSFCHEVINQYGQKKTVNNGIDFTTSYKYPCWDEVTSFAKSVGQYVPHHRLLALDIVLDNNDVPHLIEFNVLYYAPWVYQYTTGAAFGEYTDEILSFCKKHLNEIEHQILL